MIIFGVMELLAVGDDRTIIPTIGRKICFSVRRGLLRRRKEKVTGARSSSLLGKGLQRVEKIGG